MAIPGSGQVSLGDIATEFGGDVPHALSEYHGKHNAPASGEIQIAADFYGGDNSPPSPQTFTGVGTTNITIAANVRAIGVQLVGAGGGGAGAGGTTSAVPEIPSYVPSSFYDLENLFPYIPKMSSTPSSAANITVNVDAGAVVMQDDLITIINDAVIAAQKNGYTQLPNGAIVG